MSNQSTPEVTQEDRKAAEDMLNHAFRHVGVRALKDVNFRDIAEAFARHRVARMPDELREAAQRVANSALRANPDAWVVEGAPMEALLDVLASPPPVDRAEAGEKVEPWSNDPHGLASELRRVANGWAEGFRLPQLLRDAADQIDTTTALASPPPVDRADAIERAARYVLDNSRRSTASLNSEQFDADTDRLMAAYRDIIGKAIDSGALAQPLEGLTSGEGEVTADQRAHLIFNKWDKHPDAPAYWFHLPSWVQDYATECVAATERRLAASPKATATASASVREDRYLVWSNEHKAWWGLDHRGYTRFIDRAGRYDRAEALKIAGTRDGGWRLNKGNPDEIAIPEQDAIDQYADITAAQALTDSGTAATIGGERA